MIRATLAAMVRLTVTFKACSARSAQELLDALGFLALGVRLEPGCLGCSAWSELDLAVHYIEEWASEADVERRVRSDSFTLLLGVIDVAQERRVQFDFIATTRGLDYVAEVRDNFDV